MSDLQVIKDIREELQQGDTASFKRVYQSHQRDFERFCRKRGIEDTEVMSIYNDTMVALHDNILEDKIKVMTSSLKTYIFGIGKNILHKRLEKNKKQALQVTHDIDMHLSDMQVRESAEDEEVSDKINEALQRLGNSCRELLILFYYRRWSIEAIQIHMSYKNQNTVKAHKSRCMKQLQADFKKASHGE